MTATSNQEGLRKSHPPNPSVDSRALGLAVSPRGDFLSALIALLGACGCASQADYETPRGLAPGWDDADMLLVQESFNSQGPLGSQVWSDIAAAPTGVFKDSFDAFLNSDNWELLGAAVLFGELAEGSRLNSDIQRDIYKVDHLGQDVSDFLDMAGDGAVLLGASAGLYAMGLALDEPKHRLAGRNALASLGATGVSTLALKALVNDERPRGGSDGYPSGHTSMSVALATSLHSSYGWKAALPAYLLSGLVAFQRIDSGAHELDDVIVGAALGLIIARQVHATRIPRFLGAQIAPLYDPGNDVTGLSLGWGW